MYHKGEKDMKIEPNNIYNMDCLDGMEAMRKQGVVVDCIITDPPYGINYMSNRTDNHHILQNDGFVNWKEAMPKWLDAMQKVISDKGCVCVFMGGGRGDIPVTALFTLEAVKRFSLIQTLVWEKTIGLGWRYRPQYENIVILSKSANKYAFYDTSKKCGNVIKSPQHIPQKDEHPTQKPLEVIYKLLNIHTKESDLILDPFVGSGTTAVACHKLNRKYIGFEIDKGYYDMAQKRLNVARRQISLF